MKTLNKTDAVIGTTLLVLVIFVGVFILLDLGISTKQTSPNEDTSAPEIQYVHCPDQENFTDVWNSWSYEYINDNPYNSVDEQMRDWNELMLNNSCGDEWLNPLDDLIEQQSASGTPVYWKYDSN